MFGFRINLRAMMPLLVACLTIFCALPSHAQVTTGGLKVVVTDDSEFELPIADAMVVLTGESLIGGKQERLTDANGEVQFVQLLPGAYDAAVTRAGFAGVTLRGVEVKVNRTSVQYVSLRERHGRLTWHERPTLYNAHAS